jgi:hypothetical protein
LLNVRQRLTDAFISSSSSSSSSVHLIRILESSLAYADSVLILSLLLPSRQETCRFHLNLQRATIGELIDEIHNEDAGIKHVHIHDEHGHTLARSYAINSLLNSSFTIQLNQQRTFLFDPINNMHVKENSTRKSGNIDGPSTEDTVVALYHALNSMTVYHSKYLQLKQEANELAIQLEPLEKVSPSFSSFSSTSRFMTDKKLAAYIER